MICLRLALALGEDFDEHVGLRVFTGKRDIERVLVLRQRLHGALAGLDDAETARVFAHERIAAEGKLGVHQVVIDRGLAEIFPSQRDGFVFHLEVNRRLGRGEFCLLFFAVGFVVSFLRGGLAFDFVELAGDFAEDFLPARHGEVRVFRGDSARVGEVAFVKVGVAAQVVVLDFGRQPLRINCVEACQRVIHAVLQKEVIRHAHRVAGIERGFVREDVEQRAVLAEHGGIRDARFAAELVGALVDERRIFEVLVAATLDGIERDELRGKERPALREELILVLQPFAERGRVVVHERVAIDCFIPDVMRAEESGELFEKRGVPATPRNTREGERGEVVLFEEGEHVRLRAVLRDVVPRGFVELRELRDHVELERLCRRRRCVCHGYVHREVLELRPRLRRRRREIERILERLRRVRLQPHVSRRSGLAAEHGQRALRDLQKHLRFHGRACRVGDDDICAIHRAGEEFLRHILLKLLISLLPVAVAVAEETLRHE